MTFERVARRELLATMLCFTCVIAILYSPVFLLGRSVQAPLYVDHGVMANGAYNYTGRTPVNTFSVDLATPAYFEWPSNALIGDLYRQGIVPLWNPYQGVGIPLLAQYNTRAFFPYQIVENVLPRWTWDFFMLGRLWLAGLITFLFLRRLGLDWFPSFIGGLIYMFSGAFTWFINLEEYTNVAVTAPLLLFSVDGVWRWRWFSGIFAVAGSVALVLLAGQPEIAIYVLLLGALFAMFRALSAQRVAYGRKVIWLISGAVLGFGLAMPQILPFMELTEDAHLLHPLGGSMGTADHTHPYLASVMLIPTLNNMPTFIRELPENGVWDYVGGYAGIFPVCLIVTGLCLTTGKNGSRWRGLFIFFLAFTMFILLKNFGVPPFSWLGKLPLFDQAWSPRWAGPVWVLSTAVTAAVGLQALIDIAATPPKRSRVFSWLSMTGKWSLFIDTALIVFLAILAVILLWLYRKMLNPDQLRYLYPAAGAGLVVGFTTMAIFLILTARYLRGGKAFVPLTILALAEFQYIIPFGYDEAATMLRLIPFGCALIAILALILGKRSGAVVGLSALVILSISIDLQAPRGLPKRYDPATVPPYVEYVEGRIGLNRVTGVSGILYPNFASVFRLQDIRYINSMTPSGFHEYRLRYLHQERQFTQSSNSLWFTNGDLAVIERNGRGERVPGDYWMDTIKNLRYYSLLGVRYIVAPTEGKPGYETSLERVPDETRQQLSLVYEKEVLIYENLNVFPRAWIAHKVEFALSREEALTFLGRPGVDLREVAVIEERVNLPIIPLSTTRNLIDDVQIVEYSPNQVTILTRSSSSGMLVLSDLYYPGWSVLVDGAPAKLYRVNGFLRGVYLEEGPHTIAYSYSPRSFNTGITVAILSFFCLFLLLLLGRFMPFYGKKRSDRLLNR